MGIDKFVIHSSGEPIEVTERAELFGGKKITVLSKPKPNIGKWGL